MNKNDKENGANQLAFTRLNYILLGSGVLVVLLGFVLMAGGGSNDPNVFSDQIFSFRRLTLAPIVIVLGYALVLISIMKKTGE